MGVLSIIRDIMLKVDDVEEEEKVINYSEVIDDDIRRQLNESLQNVNKIEDDYIRNEEKKPNKLENLKVSKTPISSLKSKTSKTRVVNVEKEEIQDDIENDEKEIVKENEKA